MPCMLARILLGILCQLYQQHIHHPVGGLLLCRCFEDIPDAVAA